MRFSAELYDPEANGGSWSLLTDQMVWARSVHSATLLADGTVLMAGGYGHTGIDSGSLPELPLRSTEIFDPGSNRWSAAKDMVAEHTGHTATLVVCGEGCTRVLVAGSSYDVAISSTDLYDVSKGTWSEGPARRGVGR